MKRRTSRRHSFFTDENFSIRLVELLRLYDEGEYTIHALQEKFEKGTPDDEWINQIGKWSPKPIVIGGDGRILTNPARLASLQEAGLNFVYFADGYPSLPWKIQVLKVFKVWSEICNEVPLQRYPTVFKVRMQGKLEKVRLLSEYKCQKTIEKRRLGRNQIA